MDFAFDERFPGAVRFFGDTQTTSGDDGVRRCPAVLTSQPLGHAGNVQDEGQQHRADLADFDRAPANPPSCHRCRWSESFFRVTFPPAIGRLLFPHCQLPSRFSGRFRACPTTKDFGPYGGSKPQSYGRVLSVNWFLSVAFSSACDERLHYTCANGQCIGRSLVCDTINDCRVNPVWPIECVLPFVQSAILAFPPTILQPLLLPPLSLPVPPPPPPLPNRIPLHPTSITRTPRSRS